MSTNRSAPWIRKAVCASSILVLRLTDQLDTSTLLVTHDLVHLHRIHAVVRMVDGCLHYPLRQLSDSGPLVGLLNGAGQKVGGGW